MAYVGRLCPLKAQRLPDSEVTMKLIKMSDKRVILSGSTDDSNNVEGSMNTVFIPELDHEHFVLQQQQ